MVELWQPLFELTVHAHYQERPQIGRWACEQLLALEDVPDLVRQQTRRNQIFYSQRLADLVPSARLQPIAVEVQPGWSCFNPSIAADDGGYRMIARSSNYSLHNGGYSILDPNGVVRTRNYLLTLDPDFNVLETRPIAEDLGLTTRYPAPAVGFEDCRLFRLGSQWYGSCTSREFDPGAVCRIVLLTLDDGAFRSPVVFDGPEPGRHEKNWMPLPLHDDLLFIYTCRPTVVVRVDHSQGVLSEIVRADSSSVCQEFRGGTPAVSVGDDFLFVVHESVDFQDGNRAYAHRLVRMTRELVISEISPQFFFIDRGIEFCAGLAVRGDRLTLSFGHLDRDAYLATMRLDEALAMLRPVEHQALVTRERLPG